MDNCDIHRIQFCGIPQCKTCKNKQLDLDTLFYSNLTKKSFTINFHQNCKTNLVIYLISCRHPNCCCKYVGRTHHAVSRRLSLHRANIIAGTEGPAMLHHFTKVHQPSDMIIKAIEVCGKSNIKEREQFWISELNTAFPYGLNDRINQSPINDAFHYTMNNTSINHSVYETFNKNPSRRTKKGGSRRNQRHNADANFNAITFMDSLSIIQLDNNQFFINYVRNSIKSLNKEHTKDLFLHLCICINEQNEHYHRYKENIYFTYLPYLAKDISFAKLKSMYNCKKTTDKPKHFLVLKFNNKLLDSMNFNSIIHSKEIFKHFPQVQDENMKFPTVSYKYSHTIRPKITNYRQVIEKGITPLDCDCHLYSDQYKVENHVFTGNLDIVGNNELRTLMKKGLNHRETPTTSNSTIYKAIVNGVDIYINYISGKTNMPITNFLPWKTVFLQKIKSKLDKLKFHKDVNVLSKPTNIQELKTLQEKFVFTPTDKAGNNVTIVCKKQYMNVLDQEICNSGNFVKEDTNIDTILTNQTNFMNRYNVKVDQKIPFLYWTAKLHKDPYAHRFITSGRGSTTQPLSIHISKCLKTVLNIVRSNSKFHLKKHKINQCFVIDNRYPVTDFIKKANQRNDVHSVSTFDFQTLYTSIPHDKLKDMLSLVIKQAFRSRNKKFISCNGYNASMCDQRKAGFCLSINQLIECVNFLIDQSYILYKGELYRQCIGIPMGTNCAPYLANLFLYAYESKFISTLVQEGHTQIATNLINIFRFQDDCIVFNDQDTFNQRWREIYPVEMMLSKTNSGNSCTFLDLNISIENGKFTYKSYDKRLNFNFEVINYPNLESNVPHNPSYGVFTSQLVRFCEVNININDFQEDVRNLVSKLCKQNFNLKLIKQKFKRFYASNIVRWAKFGCDIYNLLDVIY